MKKNYADMQFACWCCEMGVFFYCIELVLKNKIPQKDSNDTIEALD